MRAPHEAERSRLLQRERARIEDLDAGSGAETAAVVASAVREILSRYPELGTEDLEHLLRTCDDQTYAPATSAGPELGGDLRARALVLLGATKGSGPA